MPIAEARLLCNLLLAQLFIFLVALVLDDRHALLELPNVTQALFAV